MKPMANTSSSTQDSRRKHVLAMNASFALEDMHPDAQDIALQQRYIDGEIGLSDMLTYAVAFANAKAMGGRLL